MPLKSVINSVCSLSCENGGNCVAPDVCDCPAGYAGNTCAEPICSSPCQNGGLCVAPSVCECRCGFRGITCNEGLSALDVAGAMCLRGHVIGTVPSPQPIMCAFACLRSTRCKSVNYYPVKRLCELNKESADGAGIGDWFYAVDCVYYES
ncbi:wnt inhibitory factor 1-like [Acanthaster planci]|uniref:Wnt inhibitory factor 1-like n=1 Tax=Acanthaster planci TaxID=133434 RepID=A0A8B7Y0R4_ACAPL|nr:wnt inhibitory factor 1-like [Acanthaster planci]